MIFRKTLGCKTSYFAKIIWCSRLFHSLPPSFQAVYFFTFSTSDDLSCSQKWMDSCNASNFAKSFYDKYFSRYYMHMYFKISMGYLNSVTVVLLSHICNSNYMYSWYIHTKINWIRMFIVLELVLPIINNFICMLSVNKQQAHFWITILILCPRFVMFFNCSIVCLWLSRNGKNEYIYAILLHYKSKCHIHTCLYISLWLFKISKSNHSDSKQAYLSICYPVFLVPFVRSDI